MQLAQYKAESALRVPSLKRHILLIISIGRPEATADADGDIGRSSTMDHSKALDLCFSEMYWSSFLDPVLKKNAITEVGPRGFSFPRV